MIIISKKKTIKKICVLLKELGHPKRMRLDDARTINSFNNYGDCFSIHQEKCVGVYSVHVTVRTSRELSRKDIKKIYKNLKYSKKYLELSRGR